MEKPALKPRPDASSRPCRASRLALALFLAAGLAGPAWAQQRTPEEQRKADEAAAQAAKEIAAKEAALKLQAAQSTAAKGGITVTQPPGAVGQPPITTGGGRDRAVPGQPGASGGAGTAPRTPGQAPGGLKVEGAGGATGAGSGGSGTHAVGPDEAELPASSEAIELKTLVEYVADTLQINVAGNDTLTGSVVLNAPVTVKKSDLLKFLNALLEQQNFMITKDEPSGWYKVIPMGGQTFVKPSGELATTRVIPTPTVRPSSLAQAINEQLGVQTGGARLSFLDELGVIIASDSPRHLDALSDLIAGILERSQGMEFERFELVHIAPTVARQRLLDLLGQGNPSAPGSPIVTAPGQAQQPGLLGQATSNISSIADRLTADQSSSALYFRGYPEEFDRVRQLLGKIDRPNSLHYKQYFAGSGALQIAQLAERLGLGHVEPVDASNQPQTVQAGTPQFNIQQPGGRGNVAPTIQTTQQTGSIGGPVMIVDTVRSTIIYYGTDAQQAQLEDLISKFDTDREQVVIVTYKLKNKPPDVVADTLNGIAFNQSTGGGSSSFLPGQQGFFGFPFNQTQNQQQRTTGSSTSRTGSSTSRTGSSLSSSSQRSSATRPGTTGSTFFRPNQPGGAQANTFDTNDPLGGPEVFILADTANGQVIVKAPARQQEEFAKVIAKLDQRSPQVQIEVQIVAVTANDDFRLAFETQLKAGQFNANTAWPSPLGSLTSTTGTGANTTTSGDFKSPKQVRTDLSGFTSALIKSNYVPLVMNALKENTDTRIVASPYILVDDNVEAEIVSLDEQPTTTTTQGTATTNTNFGGYEEAGTRLTVTPSISEGGYLRLMYEIELSNFVGSGANGLPPPKQTRNVRSDSVTIPGDTTIVVGGITATQASSTIAKIPLIGNIPLLGYLFRDTSINNSSTRLYVFITPRIFRDTNFRDPILYTMGPRAEAGIAPDYPDLKPAMIEMIGADTRPAEPSAEPPPKKEKPKQENHRLWPDPHAD